MFKRVIWFGVGAAAGASGSVWAQRKVKAQIERVQPSRLVESAGDVVRQAVRDGRDAMRDREFDLRQRYGLDPVPPPPSAPVFPLRPPGADRGATGRR